MKRLGIALFALGMAAFGSWQDDGPALQGAYLGQKPPGMVPEVFATGIVSREGDQGRLFIAPDGSEIIYWEREPVNGKSRIISLRNAGGVWSGRTVLPFSEEYVNNEPCLAPDGKKLFFVSNRPPSGRGEAEKLPDLWVVDKAEGKWGEPRNVGDPVNRLDIVVQPFYAADDRLYFCGQKADGSSRGLYVSRFAGGGFAEPERLDEKIFGGQVSGPCVSPDNRTLVVHARKEGGFGNWDLYASFKDALGKWGELANLGSAVNTAESEAGASFSPDGRYLFFSRAGDVYWISSKILEEVRPKGPAGDARQSVRDLSRLADPGEKRANEVQPPELIMNILGVRPGMVIGEVGAGHGRVTVHLAARVGDKGKVYANDIDPEAVDYLKERCRRSGLANVETILSLPGDARFPPNSLDLAFMAYVYHHVDNPIPLLKSLLTGLKPWGIVAMAEPKPAHVEPSAKALTRESVGKEALAAGFVLDAVIEDRLQADDIFVLRPAVPDAPESHDRQKVRALWLEYLEWMKNTGGRASPRDYGVSLEAKGVPGPEIRRRLQVLRGQFTEQPEGIEMIYDPLYGKPLTGDLEKDGFKTQPNAFLVESMKTIPAGGQALDVGAGMGRNAVLLAGLGWEVTGVDLSAQGLAVMRANAEKAGLKVRTVKTSYEDFDFGREKWDLVAMILSWAPVEEPSFLARLKESIRPGGYVVFEHVVQRSVNPFSPGVHALAPGALRELFRDFEILTYREMDHSGDWGGPPTPHVWMVARKKAGEPDGDERGRIEQAIRDCIGWAKNKDFALLYGTIANDPDFLEVHPGGKVVKGFEEFKKAEVFWGSPDFKALRYEIRDLRIKLSESGEVAWFFCLLDDINEWKGQPANWENTRWTGVLEKRDGRWTMVQQHFSFAEGEKK